MKRIFSIIAVLLLCQSVWGQVNLPTLNLEAWYPVCADTADHGGIGYDLLNTNVTLTTDRYGVPKSAYTYNGVNSQMHYSTFFAMAGPFSYSVWIYPTALQNSVILFNGDPNLNGMGFIMDDNAGGPGQDVSLWAGGIGRVVPNPGFPAISVSLNAWHQLAIVRTGNAYIFYVDLVDVGNYIPVTTPTFPGFNPPTSVFQLGVNYAANTQHFVGKIDDAIVYSRLLTCCAVTSDLHKIHDYNPDIFFSLGNDTSICPGTLSLPLNPGIASAYPYPTYHYLWDTLPGIFMDSVIPTIVTPKVGGTTYILTITRPLPSLPYGNVGNACIGIDTVKITHIAVKENLGNDTVFCRGNSTTLSVYSPSPVESFRWQNVAVSPAVIATTPTINVTTSGTYALTVDSVFTDPVGTLITCHGTDTIIIHVADSIHVHLGPDVILCHGGVDSLFSLDSSTYSTAATYTWGGPPNVGGSTAHVTVSTVTGTYWLEVNDSSCKERDTIQVTIVFDTLHVYNPDTAICLGGHVNTVASFDPSISYQWTPTAGIPSSSNPATTITPDTSAWYVLTGYIAGCVAKDSFFIDVQPNPYVYAGGNRTVCAHDTIRISPIVLPAWYTHYTYNWSPGTYIDDSTTKTVIFTPGDTTNLVLIVTTPAGCFGWDSAMIFTYNGDFASVQRDTVLCPGDSAQIIPTSTEPGITTYIWHPATYLNDSTSSTPWVKPIGSINYKMVATSSYGCRDTLDFSVIVKPAAVITLGDSITMYPGDSVQISPNTNGTYFSWTPAIGLNDTAISNPMAKPVVNTKYVVTAWTENGCKVKDSINIRVDEGSFIAVPNAFTPGLGGPNNIMKVILKGISRLRYFRIYNRWGEMIFQSTNIQNGWDGTFNGKPQPMGVYMYEAQAVTDGGIILKKQGNITLLR